MCKKEEINCSKRYVVIVWLFKFLSQVLVLHTRKWQKGFAKIQGVKRILSHIKFPAKFFLNMEKGRFSIIQICQIKSVFSSFFLNFLIHRVFFRTAKNKIKPKHKSKILQKISHISQNKQGRVYFSHLLRAVSARNVLFVK